MCSFLQRNPKHSLSLVWGSLFPAGAISQQVLALRGRLQTYYFISVSANRVQKGQHPQAALRASERTRQQISSPRKRHCQNSLPGACQQASATSDPCRSHLPLLQDALCLAKGPHVLPTSSQRTPVSRSTTPSCLHEYEALHSKTPKRPKPQTQHPSMFSCRTTLFSSQTMRLRRAGGGWWLK